MREDLTMRSVPGYLTALGGAARDRAGSSRPGPRGRAWRLANAVLTPSPESMRRIALAGVLASAGIIMTGAGVRLSQSGLGCPDWPRCTAPRLPANGATGDPLIHRWVEFGNRLVTVAIFVIAVVVWVAAWRYRTDGRRRRDVVWLASAQPAGIVAQAALGGIVVLTNLDPVWVSVHFAFSMALVAAAVALYVRCGEGRGPARLPVARQIRLFALGAGSALGPSRARGDRVGRPGTLRDGSAHPQRHVPPAR